MTCTKCEIHTKLNNSKIKLHNPNISSRIIFEKINRLSLDKKPKEDCVSKIIKEKGISETAAKKVCKVINSKEKKSIKKNNKEKYQKNELIIDPNVILNEYIKSFDQITSIKYSKINIYKDIEDIKNIIDNLDNRLWDLKRNFLKYSKDPLSEEILLKVRCEIRKKYMEDIDSLVMNESKELLIDKLVNKPKSEQIRILKEKYPDYEEDFLKEVV